MTEERIALIEDRLTRLESMANGFDARLRRIENPGARPAQQPVVPPPVLRPPAPVAPQAPPDRTYKSNTTYTSVPPVVSPKPDTEYRIGAQVLPRIGAVMLLLGVGYLISLGLSSGWITPEMLFGGAVALCLAFIGVGQWKREEKEEFGQVLTGIGSCGLYLTFAGGHVFQKLYSGETLVGLFMLLSFVNLGYSAWRASRSFLAIGLIGGLAAALMPIQKHNYDLNLGLHFAVLVPCILIAARHKWMDIAAWLWIASSLALAPMLAWGGPWQLQVFALGASTLLCVAAYSYTYKPNAFDPANAAPVVAIGITALVSFAVRSGLEGSGHLLVLAAFSGLLGLVFKGDARRSLLAAGLGIATMLAPFGCEHWVSCLILTGCAVGYALAGGFFKSKAYSGAGVATLALGLFAYLLSFDAKAAPLGLELAMLASLIGATCALAWSGVQAGGKADSLMVLASVVCLPFVVRSVQSMLVLPSIGLHVDFAIAVGLAVATAIAIVLTFASGWESGAAVAAVFGVFTLSVYGLSIFLHPALVAYEMTFIVCVLAMTGAIATLSQRKTADDMPIAAASAIVGALLARLSMVVFRDYAGAAWQITVPLSLCGYAAANSLVARWRSWPNVHYVSALAWVGAGAVYIAHMTETGYGTNAEVWILVVLLSTLAGLVALANSEIAEPEAMPCVASVAGWALFSRLALVILTGPLVEMQKNAAVSLSWTVYAVILIGVGFALSLRLVRYCGLVVIGATVGKVLLVDLAETSPGIRVGVLMALGLAMLGGGYWYIRKRQTLTP